ncbi:MAG: nitroreductase family protein [Actinobacteria bacterium]|nr:nitroreductase family protein [Actinomycetota bacterium]
MTDPRTEVFREILSTTRSIRRIAPDEVPDDVLDRVLEASTWAPSGGNRQPWRLIVVRDRATKQAISDLYAEEWKKYVDFNIARLPERTPATEQRVRDAMTIGGDLASGLADVPVLAVFLHDPSMLYVTDAGWGRHPVVGGASLYPAVQNLLVAARAEGLGGVLTTIVCAREPDMRAILGFPESWGVHALVPLGWPKGRHGPLRRAPLTEMVMRERWRD